MHPSLTLLGNSNTATAISKLFPHTARKKVTQRDWNFIAQYVPLATT